MKQNSKVINRARELDEERRSYIKKESPFSEKKNPTYHKVYSNKINLYQLRKVINDDFEKYQAQKDYEYIKNQIAREQESNEL